MGAVNFFKFDLRRSKYLFLISIVLFAPLGAMMGYTMESTLGIFSYMALVVVVTPTSLFTYELKNECGFDGLLPLKFTLLKWLDWFARLPQAGNKVCL